MGEYVFEAPLAGSWTRHDFDEARHEAGHAAVARHYGITVNEARIDRPDVDTGGWVVISALPAKLEQVLHFCLAGGLAEQRPRRIDWPPDPNGTGDEANAAMVAERMGIGPVEWMVAHSEVKTLLLQPGVLAVRNAVTQALLDRGALSESALAEIFGGTASPPNPPPVSGARRDGGHPDERM